MAWNNPYFSGYQPQPAYNPYQQYSAYQPQYSSYNQPQNQANSQVSMPTMQVNLIQVEGDDFVTQFPLAPGTSQMFIKRDDTRLYIKSVSNSGEATTVFYDRQPPAPTKKDFNPDEYVRRDEIGSIVKAAIESQNINNSRAIAAKRPVKKDMREDGADE